MAYTPELTDQYSGILRRIAWGCGIPMTKAIERVIKDSISLLDGKKVCKACRDRSFCDQCPIKETQEPLYVIGNPTHRLGFVVASSDDPLGFTDPVEALSELAQMRKEFGSHLKLYRVFPVCGPLADKARLQAHHAELDLEDFDYSLVDEHLVQE